MTHKKKNDLQCIFTSLFYLSDEAKRRGLPIVSEIIKKSIDETAAWMDTDDNILPLVRSPSLIDDSLYHALCFLHNLAALSDGHHADFVKVFEMISKQFHEKFRIALKSDNKVFKSNLKSPHQDRSQKQTAG